MAKQTRLPLITRGSPLVISLILLLGGCTEQELPPKLPQTAAPEGYAPASVDARTFVYWQDAVNILGQLHEVPTHGRIFKSDGAPPTVEPAVWYEAIARLQSLPVSGVDDDALQGVLSAIRTMNDAAAQQKVLGTKVGMASSEAVQNRDVLAGARVGVDHVATLANTFRDTDAELRLVVQKLNERYAPLRFERLILY